MSKIRKAINEAGKAALVFALVAGALALYVNWPAGGFVIFIGG